MAYSSNTIHRAERILGYSISKTAGERTYMVIDGTVYADLFDNSTAPVIDGYTGTQVLSFNGHRGTTYYNQIEVDGCQKYVKITATWGSTTFDTEIKDLLDWLEDNPATDLLDNSYVRSKKIEDFTITKTTEEEAQQNQYGALQSGWSWYIRTPLIIGVSKEHSYNERYF